MKISHTSQAQHLLKQYYGYDEFRPMQAEIIETVMQKLDCLVLMQTGGGKSLTFQIPALLNSETAIVVSPHIALMKDQVESLRANGIEAAFLNSSQTPEQQADTEENFRNGNYKLLYISPERLLSESFYNQLKTTPVSLFAIDEAHCISQWGHDFRPEYTKLSFLKKQFPNIPIIALTATADKITARDIVTQLTLNEPKTFIASFDRPNISLKVSAGQNRFTRILEFIEKRPNQSGIIYCLSRKTTEQIAEKLRGAGIKA